ncbi:hypothetical protein HL42_2209 [Trichophyton rubrum]|nr:hypothetical protein HL42_2209 [Trichophyton rubrum]
MAPTTFGEFLDPAKKDCRTPGLQNSSNNDNNDTTTIRHSLMEYSVQLDGTSRVEGSERTVHMAASLPSLFFRISSDQDPRNSQTEYGESHVSSDLRRESRSATRRTQRGHISRCCNLSKRWNKVVG